MTKLIITLVPLALKILDLFVSSNTKEAARNKEAAELQLAWLDFTEKASKTFNSSASLKKSYDAQKERMDQLEKEQHENSQKNT